MPLGSDPLAATLAGLDAQTFVTLKTIRTPRALKVNSVTKDFEQTADGQYASVHPVDAQMFNLCRIAKGSISSTSTTGQGIKESRHIDPLRIRALVDDEIRRATAQLVNDNKVRLLGNEVTVRRGAVGVRVNYHNIATDKREYTEV